MIAVGTSVEGIYPEASQLLGLAVKSQPFRGPLHKQDFIRALVPAECAP